MLSSADTLKPVQLRAQSDPLVQVIARRLVPNDTPEARGGYTSETWSRALCDVQDAIWAAERVGAIVVAPDEKDVLS